MQSSYSKNCQYHPNFQKIVIQTGSQNKNIFIIFQNLELKPPNTLLSGSLLSISSHFSENCNSKEDFKTKIQSSYSNIQSPYSQFSEIIIQTGSQNKNIVLVFQKLELKPSNMESGSWPELISQSQRANYVELIAVGKLTMSLVLTPKNI